jgi:hypothetical protein
VNPEDHWMQTFTGRKFYPLAPRVEDIVIEDIAHALAQICRWGGHCMYHFSVAQHSLNVSYMVQEMNGSPRACLLGLLHDAQEAYLGDMVRPLKMADAMEAYREAEDRLERAVWERFGLQETDQRLVKGVDRRMCVTEGEIIMGPRPMIWHEAEPPFGRPWPDGMVIGELGVPKHAGALGALAGMPRQPVDVETEFLQRFRELAA